MIYPNYYYLGNLGKMMLKLFYKKRMKMVKNLNFNIIDSDSERKEDMNTSFDNECLIF